MDKGSLAVIISVIFTAISGIVLILRCISRFVIVRKAWIDDALAILSFLGSVAVTVAIYQQKKHGLGRNISEVSPEDLHSLLKYLWASIIAYGASMTFIKASALTQYLRFLFHRTSRVVCWITLITCSMFGVTTTIVSTFSCRPVAFFWNKNLPDGECINNLAWWYSAVAWVISTDIIVVGLPIFALKDLSMPRAQKRALIFVFALGGVGCLVSILRGYSIYVAATTHNITVDNSDAAWWSAVELNIGIMCISIPPMKAIVNKVSPHLLSGRTDSGLNERLPSLVDTDRIQSCTTIDVEIALEKQLSGARVDS